MKKYSILLMGFLGASFILQGVQAQSCQLSYESVKSGSAPSGYVLDSTTPTLTEDAWALNDIDFDGDCDCTLTVYSKKSFAGCSVTQAVASTSSKHVDVVGGIWKRSAKPRSFTVTCQFEPTEEFEEIDFPYQFRELTPEEAADPIAVAILQYAPSSGLQLADIPQYHLTGDNTLGGIATEDWTGNPVYLVNSDIIDNNGDRAILKTLMGVGMNGDYTVNGIYLIGEEVAYPN